MTKVSKWCTVCGFYCRVEDGRVLRFVINDSTAYPYRYNRNGDLVIASGVKVGTFRNGYRAGRYVIR